MYVSKTPYLLKQFRKQSLLWEMPASEEQNPPALYLSFDDGPIPEITPQILDILDEFNAKATFFMVGDNVRKHPSEFQMVKDRGHAIGNHGYHHLSGWGTDTEAYVEDVEKANQLIQSSLFRPPYGRIRLQEIKALSPKYKIVMWSVLSADYDQNISSEQCLSNVLTHAKDGSIIVFHDSLKASQNLLYSLPQVLKHFSNKGFVFKSLTV